MSRDWQPQRLNELGLVGRGKSRHRPRNDARLYGGPYPFIQTADIMAADPYITSYSQTYTKFGLDQSKLWPPNTLCMTIAGANTAKTAILTFEACFPDSIVGFIPDNKKADLHFVKYSLDLMKDRFLAVTRGATQDNLSLDKLLSFPIPTPSLRVQRDIAGMLMTYDELIENNKRRIRTLDGMARTLYREFFADSRDRSSGQQTLGELCECVKRPYDEDAHADRPLLDLSRIPQRFIAPLSTADANELTTSRIVFEPGDTLFGAIRCYLHKVVTAPFPGVTNTSVLVLRAKKPWFKSLTAIIASDDGTIRWAETHSAGTKMPVLSWAVFQRMPVPMFREALAQRYENIVGPILEQIGTLACAIQNLRHTRDLLLPRLLCGESVTRAEL